MDTVEVRGFGRLRERVPGFPYVLPLAQPLTGAQLLERLGLAPGEVEAIFVNGLATLPQRAVIAPGDRVGLVPPGTPGP